MRTTVYSRVWVTSTQLLSRESIGTPLAQALAARPSRPHGPRNPARPGGLSGLQRAIGGRSGLADRRMERESNPRTGDGLWLSGPARGGRRPQSIRGALRPVGYE